MKRSPAVGLIAATCSSLFVVACSLFVDPGYEIVDKVECSSSYSLVDLKTSDANCGACGNECPDDAHCHDGACACEPGFTVCKSGSEAGACRDLQSDNANCGSCGNACGSGTSCVAGVCSCPKSNQTYCDGECVDLSTNPSHCGTCAKACASGASCTAGTCACPSSEPDICSDTCVDRQTDTQNCSTCGNSCDPGHTNGTCNGGQCTPINACSPGFADCNNDLGQGRSGNGCETDTRADDANCGSCNLRCPTSYECKSGQCTLKTRFVPCGGACTRDSDCVDTNAYCANGSGGAKCVPTTCQPCLSQANRTCYFDKTFCTYDHCE